MRDYQEFFGIFFPEEKEQVPEQRLFVAYNTGVVTVDEQNNEGASTIKMQMQIKTLL